METLKKGVSTKRVTSAPTLGGKQAAGWALLLLIACGAPTEANVPDKSKTTAVFSAFPAISDYDISAAIRTEFASRPTISTEAIHVSTIEGMVTLSGNADNILMKERAEKIALAVKGVRGVINQIEVKASGRADEEIRKDVEKALLTNPATDSYEVQAKVTDGKVALAGKVDSWAESQLAATIAKKVKGVRQVDNNIAIRYKQNRLDTEIAADIKQQLRYDARVNDALVAVKVDRGAVTLSGIVGSAFEKNQAQYDAWVTGVSSVNADALSVDPGADTDALRKDKFVNKTDAEVKAAVEDALLYDPRVSSFDVTASVKGGTVTLTGTVDNLTAKRAAEADARNVVGVWQVTNNLVTKPAGIVSPTLQARVEEALAADPVVEQYEINTTVKGAKVTLGGKVETHFEKAFAEDLVADLPGVAEVENNLKVNNAYSHLFWADAEPEELTPRESDEEIKEDIQNQIWWSPFVDHEEVTVNVNHGKATLNGTVDSWNEENAAIENAFEGGAIAVVSHLKIGLD